MKTQKTLSTSIVATIIITTAFFGIALKASAGTDPVNVGSDFDGTSSSTIANTNANGNEGGTFSPNGANAGESSSTILGVPSNNGEGSTSATFFQLGSDSAEAGYSTSTISTGSTETSSVTASAGITQGLPGASVFINSGSGSTGGLSASTSLTFASSTALSCPLITTYMQPNISNNVADVTRLQGFLRDTEHLDVNVNGTYDQKTTDAVKAFQAENLPDTMGPWHGAVATGNVYITTKQKINEITCNAPVALSAEEQAIISQYLQNQQTGTQNGSPTSATTEIIGSTGSTTQTIGDNGTTSNDNTASVINTGFFGSVWNFVKKVFKK